MVVVVVVVVVTGGIVVVVTGGIVVVVTGGIVVVVTGGIVVVVTGATVVVVAVSGPGFGLRYLHAQPCVVSDPSGCFITRALVFPLRSAAPVRPPFSPSTAPVIDVAVSSAVT